MDTVAVDDRALRRVVSTYAQALVTGDYDVGQVLFDLADQCLEVLPVDGAGVSLAAPDGGLEFLAATDARAHRVEDAQLDEQEGPCLTAFHTGKVVSVDDLEQDDRWPGYRTIALGVGYRSVLTVPMPVRDDTVGALDLYRDARGPWSDEVVEIAVSLSNLAAGYVTLSRALDDATLLNEQLQRALDVRVVVEQAKGILSGRGGRPPEEAYERIRAHARDRQMPVRDVAQGVVDGTLCL